jgi:post-segregation antitoxin (ccd killing protein)
MHAIWRHNHLTLFCLYAHNMRILLSGDSKMEISTASTRKRPVNLTINETLVAQARAYTHNLSATMESLLAEFVLAQQNGQRDHQRAADACASDWNAVHAAIGSFADGHSTL